MKILTKEQIISLHDALIKEHGGTNELRDEGLLDSAISTPYQTFGGVDLYPSIVEKAGRLGYGLIKNHPFVDGNKRIGTHAMLVLLVINNVIPKYSENELTELILGVAAGEVSGEELTSWLVEHITKE
ncbi:MAG: type II toxin-antitoxin system death-on-curing family toxin [Firmicutes bacterium]|nr:type II toxin-antitoxin system death-on-curing family toxin [Bacillota bacterium]